MLKIRGWQLYPVNHLKASEGVYNARILSGFVHVNKISNTTTKALPSYQTLLKKERG